MPLLVRGSLLNLPVVLATDYPPIQLPGPICAGLLGLVSFSMALTEDRVNVRDPGVLHGCASPGLAVEAAFDQRLGLLPATSGWTL